MIREGNHDLERDACGLYEGTILAFTWAARKTTINFRLRRSPTRNRTEHWPNTSLEHEHYNILLGIINEAEKVLYV